MADITRRAFLRHLRTPTSWVRHYVEGKVKHEGIGQSFWYRPLTAVLSEVPVDDRELPLLFHARTSDFADITVQATVTYRVSEPTQASSRLDFSIDPARASWRTQPLEQIAALLAELAQQPALDLLARMPLTGALTIGTASVRDAVSAALGNDDPADRNRHRSGHVPGWSRSDRNRNWNARRADANPGRGPAGGRPGHLRTTGQGGRTGTRHRRKRAADQNRAGAAGAAAGRTSTEPTPPADRARRLGPTGLGAGTGGGANTSRPPRPPIGPLLVAAAFFFFFFEPKAERPRPRPNRAAGFSR